MESAEPTAAEQQPEEGGIVQDGASKYIFNKYN